jgi:hypothetical protein
MFLNIWEIFPIQICELGRVMAAGLGLFNWIVYRFIHL